MRKSLISSLNQLNQNFYQQVSKDFSETRNFSWHGWHKVLKFLPNKKNLKVLDIACGNGRLLEFLEKELGNNFYYLGLDNSTGLLQIAKNEHQKHKFKYFDIVANYLDNKKVELPIDKNFDLIVAFGLTHHLPSFDAKKEFLISLKNNLSKDGIIFISNWQFAKEKSRFEKNSLSLKKIIKNKEINLSKKIELIYLLFSIGKNDYLLDWRRGERANKIFRYCHYINEQEMTRLAKKSGLRIIDSSFADGKSKTLNQYFVMTALWKITF